MRKILLTATALCFLSTSKLAQADDYIYIGQDGSFVNTNTSYDGKIITNQDENNPEEYNSIYNSSKGSIVNKLELNFKAILHQNFAKNGGAIYQQNKGLTLNSGSEFISNYATNDGGAIYLLSLDSDLIVNSSKFERNYAERFGGAIYANHKDSVISINGGSNFINNASGSDGGAIYTYGTLNLNADIGDIIFKGNTADGRLNDISTGNLLSDDTVINILGSHKVEINGGINNINKNKSSTINIGDGISGGNLDIKTADVYADQVNFNGNSNLYLTIKGSSLDPTLSYGRISANNINFYNGNNNIVVNVDINTYNGASSQTIKALEGAFSGNFDNLETDGEYNNLTTSDKYTIISSGKDGEFIFEKNQDSDGSDQENQPPHNSESNISNAWLESGVFQEGSNAYNVATHILNLSGKEREDALKALTPNGGQTVQAMTGQINSQVIGAVSSQLTGGAVSVSEGRAAGDSVFERVHTWVKMLVNRAKLSGQEGFSSDAQGVSFGVDKLITENTRFGLGYAHTSGDIDSFMKKTNLKSHTAILYAEYKPSAWYVNTIATYGWADYNENKNIAGINVKSKYDINTISLQMMTGYEFGLLTPETGLRYANFHHGSYKDSAEQKAGSYRSDLLTGVIGLKIKKPFTNSNGTRWTPEAKIAATYDLVSSNDAAIITVANGATYQTSSDSLNRLGIEIGSGVNVDVNNELEASIGYEGRFREDYQDHTGILKLKYKF